MPGTHLPAATSSAMLILVAAQDADGARTQVVKSCGIGHPGLKAWTATPAQFKTLPPWMKPRAVPTG